MESLLSFRALVVLAILIKAVSTDLKQAKVPNALILISFCVSLLVVSYESGLEGIFIGGLSFLTAMVVGLPLYLSKSFAGGDFKLLLSFSPLLDWRQTLVLIFASMVWGALLGIIMVIVKGQAKSFFHNLLQMLLTRKGIEKSVTHKVPFTVALALGYASSMIYLKTGAFL